MLQYNNPSESPPSVGVLWRQPHVRTNTGIPMPSEALTPPAALGHLNDQAVDAPQVAAVVLALWQQIDAALSPIVGQRGVAALYKRSLYLTRAAHPCLSAAYEGALQPGDFNALHRALAAIASTEATAAATALLSAFHDLLSQLIGASLTERMIGFVWHNPLSGQAVQDTPQ
ncbi:hypothetical protein [Roseateles toxinivorans]|nr:hypothetical protein [Roseateles toxinivorans]